LKGEQPLTCRPGELLEPVDFSAKKMAVEKTVGHSISERDVLSAVLYPGVFEDFDRFRQSYSDISVLSTPVCFYGLDIGDEVTIEIEEGKTLIVKLNAVGRVREDGTRHIYFELNGEPRSATIKDLSISLEEESHVKADPDNGHEIGAPMPGKIFKVAVAVGDRVEVGEVLVVTEAMKMETNVKAATAGVVKEILFPEGAQVDQGDLLVILA
jgi:pyruvate carboxylase